MIFEFKLRKSKVTKEEELVYRQLYPRGEIQWLLFEPFMEEYNHYKEYEWKEIVPIYHMNYYREDKDQGKLF